MSVKSRIAQLNARLAEKLTAKGVEADGSETTTALIDKVDSIEQGGVDMMEYIATTSTYLFSDDIQEITDDIVFRLVRASKIEYMLINKTINAAKVTVHIADKCYEIYRAFKGMKGLVKTVEIIGDTGNVTTFYEAFSGAGTVEQIICEFDFTSATVVGGMFAGMTNLKEVRFKENTLSVSIAFGKSPLLSAESVQSIIDGLADLTGATAQTLTLHADVKAKLTDTQIATITGKNWTLA